ncbi:seipin-like [Myripristis murdjan]|uniref:seipin-like n=1 Tax=Myripristis murdjan TaxID=586833 RepID=UPI001175E516|nr:seipin-like [Myripristis murdjan]
MAMLRARQRLLQGGAVLSIISLLLWTAAFLYGSFYYSYMPKAAFSTPVHYYLRTDCESTGTFPCSYPMANVSLIGNDKKQVLTFGQPYQISLELEMPESPTNQQLGMFMIKMTCYSAEGKRVGSSARSARQVLSSSSSRFGMLRYRSEILRTMGTLLFLPALLAGVTEQRQNLEVELFSDYTDDPYAPSVNAIIEIMSSKVEIYSSQLNIHAHYSGLRYLLFNFPVTSALVGVSSNFIFLSVLSLFGYMRLLLTVARRQKQYKTDGASSGRKRNMDTGREDDAKDERSYLADTPMQLDPLEITPTGLREEEPSLYDT